MAHGGMKESVTTAVIKRETTGGPPFTPKSLTRFPLPRFLAYVRVSGGISASSTVGFSYRTTQD